MTWRRDRLPELVRAMAGRPRHEALRGHLTELLRSGFGASYEDIAHEVYLLDNSGRIDTLWGATVIELKSDLRRELDDVLARMPAYLAAAAARSRSTRPVTGLATDGATFIAQRHLALRVPQPGPPGLAVAAGAARGRSGRQAVRRNCWPRRNSSTSWA